MTGMSLVQGVAWMFGFGTDSIDVLRDRARVDVQAERTALDSMASRAVAAGAKHDANVVESARARITVLLAQVDAAETAEHLGSLVDQAEEAGRVSAYICPPSELVFEGENAVATLEEWGLPAAVVSRLRTGLVSKLSDNDPAVARGALHVIFEEYDAWQRYIDDYNEEMQLAAYRLMFSIAALTLLSAFLLYMHQVVWGLLTAGGAGACLSVISKMPGLSTWGEHAAYRRRLLSRVASGLAASIIGSGFFMTDLVPLKIGGASLPGIVAECVGGVCVGSSILVLMAVAMVLGFSERALVPFEERLLGSTKKAEG